MTPSSRPGRATAIAQVRGTLLTSSLAALRSRRLVDAYMAALPLEHHEAILATIAGSWVPIELAVAHYHACDALGLSIADQVQIGVDVASRVHGTLLGTLTKLATNVGVTPWVGIRQGARLWQRIVVGGDIATTEVGPKEARIVVHCPPLAPIGYFRTGLRGIIQGGCELFCGKAYVRELPTHASAGTLVYRVAWA